MWWKTLGVTPDADIEAIKKAYSTLIKEYRPEQYPEQFSQIRQAFEVARKQAPKKAIGKTKAVTRKPNAEVEPIDATEENPISPVVAQKDFLKSLGAVARTQVLVGSANAMQKQQLESALIRLTAPSAMGDLFKAVCAVWPSNIQPAGFSSQ